jgi:SAM-dependent methyltransferase
MSKLEMIKDRHLGGYMRGGDPGTWCPILWQWAVRQFDAGSVLDVGCGEGQSTRYFHELGCDVEGIDGCEQALRDSVIPERAILHDMCAGPYQPSRLPDLIWTCEFLEHVEERYMDNILRTLATARKAILATHAFPDQRGRGHHHVNCRRTAYWIRRIEDVGFRCDPVLSRQARAVTLQDYPGINHFARSGLVFVRNSDDETPASDIGVLDTLWHTIAVEWKAAAINWGFGLSPRRLVHKYQSRARKRAAKRQRAAA